ncbi:MAG TPA: Fic family protein, partial [Longibacter sp.]
MNYSHKWEPISDLPPSSGDLANDELSSLSTIWKDERHKLEKIDAVKRFNERLLRQWAIETGIIERLYTLDEGTTQLLIEQGIDASLISHGSTNKDPQKVARLIKDQHEAAEGLFAFVANQRPLSNSYIKELH